MVSQRVTIGLDIGASKVLAARIQRGRIIASHKIFFKNHTRDHVPQCIFSAIENVREGKMVHRIGIGVPCVVSEGKIKRCFNIDILESIGLKQVLEKKYRAPVTIMNDTNAMLAYELWRRPELRKKRVLFIAWGTGIGGAFSINGKIQEGKHGLCGEIGHTILCMEDMRSFEDYAAGISIRPADKILWVSDMIQKKNSSRAKVLFLRAGTALGAAILNISYCFDPDVIVVGGGLHRLLPYVLPYVRKTLKTHGLTPDIAKIPIVHSCAPEDAGVLGAVLI